ncbi:HAT [Hexamita inflata]|uniref:C-terminal dimerisation domain n=1 Tax=Hexamita inflata TaxID=28002 RepID=A0AA86RDI1_9EUKA|nr:C-terminal dimerisation domain [Hexamita inflata]
MSTNQADQAFVQEVISDLKQDLVNLHNKYAKSMLTLIYERERKHLELHNDIANFQKMLKYETQVTFSDLSTLVEKLNGAFQLSMSQLKIWKYKNTKPHPEKLKQTLKEQYAGICKQTSFMCRIMECLVVSEAEIERVNSHMRRQLHYQRSRLLPKTIENILYIKYSQYSWEQFIQDTENEVINAINQE